MSRRELRKSLILSVCSMRAMVSFIAVVRRREVSLYFDLKMR